MQMRNKVVIFFRGGGQIESEQTAFISLDKTWFKIRMPERGHNLYIIIQEKRIHMI